MKSMAFVMLSLLLSSLLVNAAYAQEGKRKVESVTIPYTATNADRTSPVHYSFQSNHIANWILEIRNELVYNSDNPDAKVVIRLKEEPASENYIEVAMFGASSHTFSLATANEQTGYTPLYESENGWLEDKPIMVSYIENDRLSVNNAQRNILDRMSIGPFVLNTIEVYGKDSTDAASSALGGQLIFDVISGNPLENPIMMIPAILAVVAVGTAVTLVKLKKRT